jgi:hypothetical protein
MKLCECGCGQPTGTYKGRRNRFVRFHHARLSGERHHAWRGGDPVLIQGYWYVPIGHGKRRKRSIVVAERAMGKPLPKGAHVHHVNEIKTDDRNENLVVCQDAKYHQLLHVRARALRDTGDANMIRCRYCKEYDRPENMTILARGGSAGLGQHRRCHTEREVTRQRERRAVA